MLVVVPVRATCRRSETWKLKVKMNEKHQGRQDATPAASFPIYQSRQTVA